MDRFSDLLKKITALFMTVSQTGLALISLILVIYLLLGGDSGTFILSVVNNLSALVAVSYTHLTLPTILLV